MAGYAYDKSLANVSNMIVFDARVLCVGLCVGYLCVVGFSRTARLSSCYLAGKSVQCRTKGGGGKVMSEVVVVSSSGAGVSYQTGALSLGMGSVSWPSSIREILRFIYNYFIVCLITKLFRTICLFREAT